MSKMYSDLLKAYLTEENIAKEAYFLWERQGMPNGDQLVSGEKVRDIHWFSAIRSLETAAEIDADYLNCCSDIGKQIIADSTCSQNCCAGL